MKILWLAKRDTMGQDQLAARFGRFYHLPLALSRRGHDVTLSFLSYRRRGRQIRHEGALRVLSHDLTDGPRYYRALVDSRADIVVGSSDTPYLALAASVAKKNRAALVADLFDNFEGYASARVPGMSAMGRRALHRASVVCCVSDELRAKLSREMPGARVEWLENGVDPALFSTRAARSSGLARVFGYAGALSESRGLDVLFRAWSLVRRELPEAELRLVGTKAKRFAVPVLPGVRFEGAIDPSRVPAFLAELDVALVLTRPGAFGDYAFPMKLHEALAVGVPVVATAHGPLASRLAAHPEALFPVGDFRALAERMITMAREPRLPKGEVPTWDSLAARLEGWLS